MKLRDLLQGLTVRATRGDLDVEITAIVADSRLAVSGSLFVAIPGMQYDGAKFIAAAIEKGAAAVVTEAPHPQLRGRRADEGLPLIEVDDARLALASIAANFYGHPADRL